MVAISTSAAAAEAIRGSNNFGGGPLWILLKGEGTKHSDDRQSAGLTPAEGSVGEEESPFEAAERIAAEYTEYPHPTETAANRRKERSAAAPLLDEFGIKDGREPDGREPDADEKDKFHQGIGRDSWTFLGRYRNSAGGGGGFTYCYWLRDAAASILNDRHATAKYMMGTDEVEDALMSGDFLDLSSVAAMSLAMHYYSYSTLMDE